MRNILYKNLYDGNKEIFLILLTMFILRENIFNLI